MQMQETSIDDPDIHKFASTLSNSLVWKATINGVYAGFVGLKLIECRSIPGAYYAFGSLLSTKPLAGVRMIRWLKDHMPAKVVCIIWMIRKDKPRVYKLAKRLGFTHQQFAELMIHERNPRLQKGMWELARWLD